MTEAQKAKKSALAQRLSEPPRTSRLICLDTETTGLDPRRNAVVELAIVAEDGTPLFHEYIKPPAKAIWTAKAEAVNGIHPETVADELTLTDYRPLLQPIFDTAEEIVGYNGSFDLSFLANAGIRIREDAIIHDVMQDFAPIYGAWNDYHQSYTWQKLTTCAAYYHYEWTDAAHGALADTLATLYCFKKMQQSFKTKD